MGLRESNKQRTRQRIADAAWTLFGDRGFDGVSVAEVARAAEVAEATVFNYFPSKDAIMFSGLELYASSLVEVVRSRPSGVSGFAAFRDEVLGSSELPRLLAQGQPEALHRARTMSRVIAGSPTLQEREQLVLLRHVDPLAVALSSPGPLGYDPVLAPVVATALIGAHASMIRFVRRRIVADERVAEIATDLLAFGTSAFRLLENGFGAQPWTDASASR